MRGSGKIGPCLTLGTGPNSNHVSSTPIRQMGRLRPERKMTYPGSLAGPAGPQPYILPMVHFQDPQVIHAPASEARSQLKPTERGSAASLLNIQKKPCGSQGSTPREPNQIPLAGLTLNAPSSSPQRSLLLHSNLPGHLIIQRVKGKCLLPKNLRSLIN